MRLSKIRLELARDSEFPQGSHERGYEFVAPLGNDGRINAAEWKKQRAKCRVRRFWAGEPDEHGHLMHKPGGSWAFHYEDPDAADDEESGYRLSEHHLSPGEYVSIKEHQNHMRTYKVVSVTEL